MFSHSVFLGCFFFAVFPGVAFYAKEKVWERFEMGESSLFSLQNLAKAQEQIALLAAALNSAADTIQLAVSVFL